MPSRSKKNKCTMITVEQMVDIALGTPEIGAVNFNVLHALLHVIIQQLNIQRCLVEFKGHDSERMEGIIMTAKPGPILKISEYVIDTTDGKVCDPDLMVPVPQQTGGAGHPGRARSSLMKSELGLFAAKADESTREERVGRTCDCGQQQEKKDKKEKRTRTSKEGDGETEKEDTTPEKWDKTKEEMEPTSELVYEEETLEARKAEIRTNKTEIPKKEAKDEETPKRGKRDKAGEETEPESDKDVKKLSKKERCKEKKLAKKKKREEEEAAALLEAEAREKSEAEQSEKEKRKKFEVTEYEAVAAEGRRKKSCPCKEGHKQDESCPELKLKETSSSYYGSDSEGGCQTIVRVEAIGERCDTWRSRPALAHESLVKLEEKVTLLQEAFETLEKMPTNEELMKRTSSNGCIPTPVKDMWQLYNLNKRVESCEGAIEKLASMIEDLVKQTTNFREAMMVIADAVDSMESQDESCPNRASPCCGAQPGQPHRGTATSTTVGFASKPEVVAYPAIAPNPCGAFTQAASATSRTVDSQTADGQVTIEDEPMRIGSDFFKMSPGEKFCVLKESIECVMCQFKTFTDIIPMDQLAAKLCVIVSLQKHLEALQKEWEEFLQSFSDDGVPGTVNYIKGLKADIETINDAIAKLIEEKRQLELSIQALAREIELLRAMKADKETMEDLLAEKADASVVNRKVSHDQFDAACDDLTKGLDEALERLIAQEAMWNEAMDELQKDMENKLDKLEIMPLKEFINKKLKGLQEKLQQLAQLRKDAEAAGAKSRILRNLNCIACDNDVIMRMDHKGMPQHPSLPPSRSMRPYIAYELDQVRKALKKGPTCRGNNAAEEAVAEVQKKNIGLPLSREGPENKINKMEHYCNRYCGGSHTITTPQQRVTRIGHFLTEFGPQAMAMFNQDNLTLPECKPVEAGNASTLPIPRKDIRLD